MGGGEGEGAHEPRGRVPDRTFEISIRRFNFREHPAIGIVTQERRPLRITLCRFVELLSLLGEGKKTLFTANLINAKANFSLACDPDEKGKKKERS